MRTHSNTQMHLQLLSGLNDGFMRRLHNIEDNLSGHPSSEHKMPYGSGAGSRRINQDVRGTPVKSGLGRTGVTELKASHVKVVLGHAGNSGMRGAQTKSCLGCTNMTGFSCACIFAYLLRSQKMGPTSYHITSLSGTPIYSRTHNITHVCTHAP